MLFISSLLYIQVGSCPRPAAAATAATTLTRLRLQLSTPHGDAILGVKDYIIGTTLLMLSGFALIG